MKKFRANSNGIDEIEIIKETNKQVVFLNSYKRETREAKISDWDSWHNTKDEAINYLVTKKQNEIDQLMAQIEYRKHQLNKIYKF